MARILIAGCGDLGQLLGIQLHGAGNEVWGLKRQPINLSPVIYPLVADLTDAKTLKLPQALDYVIYSAAATSFSEDSYQAIYAMGVRNLISNLYEHRQQLKRFIFVSSTSVYAQDQGEYVDEDTPTQANNFSIHILTGEKLTYESPWESVVVRFGGIYGPGRSSLIDSVRRGIIYTQEPIYTNRIHRDDCVRVLKHLIYLPSTQLEKLYIAVDDEPALLNDVLCWIADKLGLPGQNTAPVSGTSARSMRRYVSSKRCRNSRLRDSGFQFIYPNYREGYTALLNSYNN